MSVHKPFLSLDIEDGPEAVSPGERDRAATMKSTRFEEPEYTEYVAHEARTAAIPADAQNDSVRPREVHRPWIRAVQTSAAVSAFQRAGARSSAGSTMTYVSRPSLMSRPSLGAPVTPAARRDSAIFRDSTQASIQWGDQGSNRSNIVYTMLVTAMPVLRACRHKLLPWVTWLPLEIGVVVATVSPPLAFFTCIFVGQQEDQRCFGDIQLGAIKMRVGPLMVLCSIVHFVYLALRAFATACRPFEIAMLVIFILWVLTIQLYVYNRRLRSSVAGWFLSIFLIVLYTARLVMLARSLKSLSRQLVSKKKRRFVDIRQGLDLDLAYVTKRIVAMGFPSESRMEAQFRNSAEEVQRFFELRHKESYKVYNLCIERVYSHQLFEEECHEVRFPDHNPCTLEQLRSICGDMTEFYRRSRKNVVAVHCKAGKGRTGLVVCSFLLHLGKCLTAREALELFGKRRTFNGKGVTIPSQIRYVHHYETVVRERGLRPMRWLRLLRLNAYPDVPDGPELSFQVVTPEEGTVFDSSKRQGSSAPPILEGDVKLVFFQHAVKLFHIWLHTAYDPASALQLPTVTGAVLWDSSVSRDGSMCDARSSKGATFVVILQRQELDGLHKDKEGGRAKVRQVAHDFHLSVTFETISWREEHEASAERHRLRAQLEQNRERRLAMEREVEKAGSFKGTASIVSDKSTMSQSAKAEDYDALDNDTDQEEMLTTLHSGYLMRSRGRWRSRVKRWCEISTSGLLHISGKQLLVVDLASEGERVFQVVQDKPSWRVRNSNHWELLEPHDDDLKQWDQAFSDALRLGAARRNAEAIFCGFFWKLNSGVEEEHIQSDFNFSDWRVRLFVLHVSGEVRTYSWKDQSEVVFLDVSDPASTIERLPFTWRSMPHTVIFQVKKSGGTPRILAAKDEDFNVFMALTFRIQRTQKA